MREEKLFRAIGLIDGELVEEAEHFKPKKKTGWWKYGTLVASLFLLICTEEFMSKNNVPQGSVAETEFTEIEIAETELLAENSSEAVENVQIGKRDVLDFTMTFDGMGFEGIMGYEMLELGHPWRETDAISTLPIIDNHSIYAVSDSRKIQIDVERYDEMLSWAIEVAAYFGMEDIKPEEKREYVLISNNDIQIKVDGDMKMSIEFLNGCNLPDEFNLSEEATREETYELAEYLVEQYAGLLDMENPQIAIGDGDYTFDAERTRNSIHVYEQGDTAGDTLLNYHFNYVRFVAWEDRGLWFIDIVRRDTEPVLGEYEIISLEEATYRLGEGQFDTTYHMSDFPGVEYIRDVELVYYMSFIDDYKPYYRFWVEVPAEKQENGLNTYVAYYVPAVEMAYLELTFN